MVTFDCLCFSHLCKLASVLSSANMELRRTAGEAIALLYEKAREIDEVNLIAMLDNYRVTFCNYVIVCKHF